MPSLINATTPNAISVPFVINSQVTVFALGLGPQDYVEFDQLLMSEPPGPSNCDCPPLYVSPLTLVDSTPLNCCGNIIQLSAANSYAILNGPQNVPLRARLVTPTGVVTIQRVWYEVTQSTEVSDTQRGCCPPWYTNAFVPVGCDAMIYGPNPDWHDPKATVVLTKCTGGDIVGYLYPTPQVGANVPVYACGCDGELLGFAVNASSNPACH